MAETEDRGWQRLDTWLWCARFLRTRVDSARFVAQGLVRINRQPTGKAHARLRVGDVITLPLAAQVRVVEVLALAPRRGGAWEARLLYREIPPAGSATTQAMPCEPEQSAAYPRA